MNTFEVLMLILLLANAVMFVGTNVMVLLKANRMPNMPDYPPASWDKLQLLVENKLFWPVASAFIVLGAAITAILVS